MILLTDSDFNMRRKFYEASKEFALKSKKADITYQCKNCDFISTTQENLRECPICGKPVQRKTK